MTLRAYFGERTVVNVVSRVAGITVLRSLLEVLCHVALTASRGDVQTKERVGRQIVIESHIAPLRGGVTLLTRLVHG